MKSQILSLALFAVAVNLKIAASVRKDASEIPSAPFSHGCRIVINEINIFSPSQHQFIELARVCEEESGNRNLIHMDKFKLLFIHPDGELIGVCHLQGTYQVGPSWFYVIGQDGVENLNFDSSLCELSIFQPNSIFKDMKTVMPKGVDFPIGIVLIRNDLNSVLKNIKLIHDGAKYRRTKIISSMEKTIINNLSDFYVYGSSSTTVFCDYFKTFYSAYSPLPNSMLRDFGLPTGGIDRSLNRCIPRDDASFSAPLQPKHMKYATTTPGIDNNCEDAFEVILEPQLKRPRLETHGCYSFFRNEEAETVFLNNPANFEDQLNAAQNKARNVRQHENTNDHSYAAPETSQQVVENVPIVQAADTPANNPPDVAKVSRGKWIRNKKTFKPEPISMEAFEENLETHSPYIWQDCSRFPQDQLQELQSLNHNPLDISKIMDSKTCFWIEFLIPVKKIRCKLCHSLLKQNILVERPGNIPDIITEGAGRLTVGDQQSASAARTSNSEMIATHQTHPLHLQAIEYYKLYDEGKRGDNLKAEFEKDGGLFSNYIKATQNLVIASLQSALMGISYRNFDILTNTLKYFQVPIGHLYQNYHGMSMGLQIISDTMHKELMNYLNTFQPELGITIDTMTDIGGYSSMGIIFQTFSPSREIKVYLYRIVYMPDGETGIKLFEKFKECIQKDGIENYIRNKVVSLGTDGAPNLSSVFRQMLNEYVTNELLAVKCHCHRLEILLKKSLDSFEFLRHIDDVINKLFRFFSAKSAKRNDVLRDEIKEFGGRNFHLKRIQRIRWINSKVRAISPILTRFKPILESLKRIKNDKTFRLVVREQSEQLSETLKGGTFLATVAFLLDINSELADLSRQMQKRGNSLIGKKAMRDEIKEHLIELKTKTGPNVEILLSNAEFVDEEDNVDDEININNFETRRVKYFGIQLNTPNIFEIENTLQERGALYIDSVIAQLENYFPESIENNYDIFYMNNFPPDSETIETYGIKELLELNLKLKWGYNEEELKNDWKTLIRSLISNENFEVQKVKTPEEFYTFFLENVDIAWTDITKAIIRRALTSVSNSAENERAFSIYSYVKTLRRFSLLPASVESIVRIRFNLDKDLKSLDTIKFAKALLSSHSRADDASRSPTYKRRKDQNDDRKAESNESLESNTEGAELDSNDESEVDTDELNDDFISVEQDDITNTITTY